MADVQAERVGVPTERERLKSRDEVATYSRNIDARSALE